MNSTGKLVVLFAVAVAVVAIVVAKDTKHAGEGRAASVGPDEAVPRSADATGDVAVAAAPQAALPTLVCVGSGRCIPCRAMEPVRDQLKREYAGKLAVEFHEISQERDALDRFSVRVIPTSIFYDASGNEVDRFEGFIDRRDILDRFARAGISF
jgi:thioredoxin 1